ncbi:MAG TPA: hypothetical protein VLB04_12865 [Methanotrichaceae archaeon]|nr:hypothetical protein [Methanotrichaceae archaeon]
MVLDTSFVIDADLLILPITEEAHDVYGALSSAFISGRRQISDFGEIIAAIVISHSATIITKDRHFDRIPMLNVVHY